MINVNPGDVSLTPAQAQDLRRRMEEYEAGKAKMIPGDEVIAQLRNRRRDGLTGSREKPASTTGATTARDREST